MTKYDQLLTLFCTVSDYYHSTLAASCQRLSNNSCPKFTDEEGVTVYIFGIMEGMHTKKACYEFVRDYWGDCFPLLPSYEKFNYRINYLADSLISLCGALMTRHEIDENMLDHVLDSMPIVVAKGNRSGRAKAASELCSKGYCDSKNMWYYGVKLHILGCKKAQHLPEIRGFEVTPASVHDLTAAKPMLENACNFTLIADKAYIDESWKAELSGRGITLVTPIKALKGENRGSDVFSSFVASERQPIESLNSWIERKTRIQQASSVRSLQGLIAFIAARIAALFCF